VINPTGIFNAPLFIVRLRQPERERGGEGREGEREREGERGGEKHVKKMSGSFGQILSGDRYTLSL